MKAEGERPATGRSPAGGTRAIQVLAVLAILGVIALGMQVAFDFLRDSDANRFVIVGVAIAVGVGGVFALFWVMDRIVTWLPARMS